VPRLVLVVPCRNEGSRLKAQPFLRLVAANRDVQLLFVDAGSRDGTAAILADMASGGGTHISVLTLPRRAGLAEASRRGVLAAFGQGPALVSVWDADLSTPLSELASFLEVFDAHPAVDIVMGARIRMLGRDIRRRRLPHYAERVFAGVASFLLGVPVYDTQCGARVFRATDAIAKAFASPFHSRWMMNVEILARYLAATGVASAPAKLYELPLRTWSSYDRSHS